MCVCVCVTPQKDRLSRDEMQQFIREVELLRRLHHRNIVQVRSCVCVCVCLRVPCLGLA